MRISTLVLSAVPIAIGFAGAAQAQVTTYNNAASFGAAVTGASTSTFGTGAGSTYVGATGVSGPGYAISSFYLFNNNPSYTTNYYDWGSGNSLSSGAGYSTVINFTTPVTAFGLNLATFLPLPGPTVPTTYGYDITITTSQGTFTVNTFDRPNLAFFGATSATGFTSLALSVANSSIFYIMDNLTLATANATAPVPEPATWAMMIAGFGLVGGAMRRKVRQSDVRFNMRIREIESGVIA